VNAALLKQAFLEMKDRGKTLISPPTRWRPSKSCASRSPSWIGGGSWWAAPFVTFGDPPAGRWSAWRWRAIASWPGSAPWTESGFTRRGQDYTEAEVAPGHDAGAVLRAALKPRLRDPPFRDDGSVAGADLHRERRPDRHHRANASSEGGQRMNGWRRLFQNAWYIAVREYRGRVRQPQLHSRHDPAGLHRTGGDADTCRVRPVLQHEPDAGRRRGARSGCAAAIAGVLESQLNGSSTDPNAHKAYLLTICRPKPSAPLKRICRRASTTRCWSSTGPDNEGSWLSTLRTEYPKDGSAVKSISSALAALEIDDSLYRAGTSVAARGGRFSRLDRGTGQSDLAGDTEPASATRFSTSCYRRG